MVNPQPDPNPFASPRPTADGNETGAGRRNRLKLLLLSVLIGVMHGGTAGALTSFAFAIYLAVADMRNIGMTMFLYFVIGVFYSFFVGGLAGTLFAFAIVLWTLSGTLVRWMHGAEDIKH